MDTPTILMIAEKMIPKGFAIYSAFVSAVSEAGADDSTLDALEQKFITRIEHEKEVLAKKQNH